MPPKAWGEGSVDQLPSGKWRVRWREGSARRSNVFATKPEAERFRRKTIGDLAAGLPGAAPDPTRFPPLEVLAQEWIERRKTTHRSWSDDRGRWNHHLSRDFGRLRAGELDVARIRAYAERRLREGANHDSIRLAIACLSSLCTDLCERPRETGLCANPCIRLPRSLRRLYRSEHDPRLTPYVERLLDVRRLYQAMAEPQRVAYAVGVCAGLRPGEILALRWDRIHPAERIDVLTQAQDGREGPLKDDDVRMLQGPFLAPLWPILAAWQLKTGGHGLVFPPTLTRTPGRRMGEFMHPSKLARGLAAGARICGLEAIEGWSRPWYQATRHTFATHWLRAGHPLGELALMLGHSSTGVSERYAHIRPGPERDDPWTLDLEAPPSEVGSLAGHETRQKTAAKEEKTAQFHGPGAVAKR